MTTYDLNHKTALVCGSTQGIGLATAQAMARSGASLVLMARDEEKLKATVQSLPVMHPRGHSYLVADFSNYASVRAAADELQKLEPVHILVNNTGGPPAGQIMDANIEAFLQAFEMHLICNHILVQAVVPGMRKAGYGRIINVISTSVKQPLPNLGVSNTIRGAVANWAKTLASELGEYGITVNNVLPGATATGRLHALIDRKAHSTGKSTDEVLLEMAREVPLKRVGQPEEIAAAICFLASPDAAYVNGINLPVDGGRTGSL